MNPELARRLQSLSPEKRALLELRLGKGAGRQPSEPEELKARPRGEPPPLSFAQQRLWLLDRLEPGSAAYNLPVALEGRGRLDPAVLRRSLCEVVRRHEVLRTTFDGGEGEPVQHVAPHLEPQLPRVDLRGLGGDRRREEALRLAGRDARRVFDLARGPLLAVTLVRLEDECALLLVNMHHIVSDGWSMRLFVDEMTTLYQAFRDGAPSPLPPLSLQYADYALWQRRRLSGDLLERQVAYWRRQLAGAQPLELPADRPRPPVQSSHGGTVSLAMGAPLAASLRALGRRHDATPFMTFLAVFMTLLARHCGQSDVTVGSPVAHRTRRELEGLIGFFVNTLVLRGDLSRNPTFAELLQDVRQTALEAYNHQDLPFEKLVEELDPERSLSRNPLFQVMLLVSEGTTAVEVEGLALHSVEPESTVAKLDLTLTLQETGNTLLATLEYSRDLFELAAAERLLQRYHTLLESVVADPDCRVSRLALLGAVERRQLLEGFNPPAVPRREARTIPELFHAQAERTPEATALVSGREELSYRQLEERVRHLADRLRELGVGTETRVGVCIERSVEMVVSLLAVLEAGGAYVPLDPAYPATRLDFMLSDSGATLVLAGDGIRESWPSGVRVVSPETSRSPEQKTLRLPRPPGGRLAYMIYTSGSTGRPKGVEIEHPAAVAMMEWARRLFPAPSLAGVLASTSISFDLSVFELFVPLSAGGTVLLARDALALAALPAADRVTLVNTVPSAATELLRIGALPPSVQVVNLAGEPLKASLAKRLYETGHVRSVYNLYGPSEDTTYSTFARVDDPVERAPVIGRAIDGSRCHVLGPDLELVGVQTPGELLLGGHGLARGYHGRPSQTAERFVPDPFGAEPGARLYRTGDLVRWSPEGELEFLGRRDHQVKLRGFRIELGEIENALEAHPAVREAVVELRRERPAPYLAAYVTAAGEAAPPGELEIWLRRSLPEHMVPRAWVILDALPLLPNGKVDRRALPAPGAGPARPAGGAAPWSDPVEELLAGLWSELLGSDAPAPADNFFELGGHSLLATRLLSRIRHAFGVELPLATVFQSPTLGALAGEITAATRDPGGDAAPIRRRTPGSEIPLAPAQKRLWILEQLDPGNAVYNVAGTVRLRGPLSPSALAASLGEIVRRHEALRTGFPSADGEPRQAVRPPAGVPLPVIDLASVPAAGREARARRLAETIGRDPFDLEAGLPLRAALLRLGERDHVALLVLHHIVSDAWSLSILTRELAALYEACLRRDADGKAVRSPLPELPIQYADYALWQAERLSGERLERRLAYWREKLAGAPTALALSTDRPRPAVPRHRGARLPVAFPPELHGSLVRLARAHQATLFMVLLAAFQALLHRLTGQPSVLVGTPVAGRTRREVEGLIGFFLNTLVMRGDAEGDTAFHRSLGRLRSAALEAYTHQDLPFELLVEEMRDGLAADRSPFFQVMLSLQNTPPLRLELADLEWSLFEIDRGSAKLDLTFELLETEEGLRGAVEYDRSLFDATTVRRLSQRYVRLLAAIAGDPEQLLRALPLLSPAERHELLAEDNDTAHPPADEIYLHEAFAKQAARTPQATALLFRDEALSYRQLDRRANHLAQRLRRAGVGPEARVGIFLERSPELVCGLLGILKAGGAYLPLDPAHPAERLSLLLHDAEVPVLLTREGLLDRLPPHRAQVICLETPDEHDSAPAVPLGGEGREAAYVIYTSGSTGRPKGVVVPHRAARNFLRSMGRRPGLSAGDTLLAVTTLSFDISVLELLLPLTVGARVALASSEEAADGQRLQQRLRKSGANVLQATPATWRLLLEASWQAPRGLKMLCGGEALGRDLADRLLAGGGELWNVYGPTETTVWSTLHRVRPGEPQVPIGRPIANTDAYVVGRGGRLVPPGVPGELLIGGDGVTRGYLGRAALTAEKFVPHPWSDVPGARLYRTGDLAVRRADGRLLCLGRFDFQVKVRGFRIELGEVEHALAGHPRVRHGVVTAVSETSGEGRLVAYLVAEDERPDLGELRGFLRRRLPEPMVPTAFVFLEALPLNTSGKVDRAALPSPLTGIAGSQAPYREPRTEVERTLVELWQSVLGVERIGIDDHFLHVGGDSVRGVRLAARAREAGLELAPRLVFEHPTIAQLAARVSPAGGPAPATGERDAAGVELDEASLANILEQVS